MVTCIYGQIIKNKAKKGSMQKSGWGFPVGMTHEDEADVDFGILVHSITYAG